jgi:imidazole glycerol-phosphate synthase subunit HisF
VLSRRIIPCLDVKDGVVVKGTRFRQHQVLGDILDFAKRYRDEGADELVFYDITASSERRRVATSWVESIAKLLDIPFCVAGGIRSVDDARELLSAGADKISINSPAIENPDLINEMVREFGSQCVVIGVDTLLFDGEYTIYQYTGSASTIRPVAKRTLDWVREVVDRGAGEIVLNCMGSDGTHEGYDTAQLKLVRELVSVPLIASGGAGKQEHFLKVFREANVDGALAAGVFHRREINIGKLKNYLKVEGIEVRI